MKEIRNLTLILFFLYTQINYRFVLANTIIPIIQHPDHEALLAIKSEISDDRGSALSSWNNSLHFCEWRGVACGRRHKRVVGLDLSSSNLVGTLSPFVGNLTFLRTLNLFYNSFHGNIPHQISHLGRLQELELGRNFFEGEIPANLSRCSRLVVLGLKNNKLSGRIPIELASFPNLMIYQLSNNNLSGRLQDIGIGNMSTSLTKILLFGNHLGGNIPDEIGRLQNLMYITLGSNMISGTIPPSLYNLSKLETLYISDNDIHGHLPQDIGLYLPKLRQLSVWGMVLDGQVPNSLSNLSNLEFLDISFNYFEGKFSLNGNKLPYLHYLNIENAFQSGRDHSFLDTLANCTRLKTLFIGSNSFAGSFPHAILNLSTSLNWLGLHNNQFSGPLPPGLGKFVNLYALSLEDNHFSDLIPSDISMLESMEQLFFTTNNFSGEVPYSIGNMSRLSVLAVSYNNLDGSIPKSLGNSRFLQHIYLSRNKFSGVVPIELFHISSLIELKIDRNKLNGSLPIEIGGLQNLVLLDVSHNKFSGQIPSTFSECTSLSTLNMSGNSFEGSIPESLGPLKSIQYLDLSCNNLSGRIPSYFPSWPYLMSLNLSFNHLDGEVPTNGVFANASAVLVVGNSNLCGGVPGLHLPRCPSTKETKRRRLSIAMIVIISIVCLLIVVISLTMCFFLCYYPRRREDASSELQMIQPFLEVSYHMLSRATNNFSPSNLLGFGGYGSVYKGILHQDDLEVEVAVKVINLQNKGAIKSFTAECNALRNIRHRNLVKIITACSSIDTQRNEFKALVYEFIPRGSLESWLHRNPGTIQHEGDGDDQSCALSLLQRLSIAIDIASALEYLHFGCPNPIIHCDLKPSNILLDDEMTAHVGDFGLAKFLLSEASSTDIRNHSSSTQVRGTVGYASPEYGLGSKASTEGDVYSFGIIVLEMMTSKKPTDPMFNNGLNIHEFAKAALTDQVVDIMDPTMLNESFVRSARKVECIKTLIMVGVKCSLEVSRERMNIKNVVNELKLAKQNLLN